MREHIEWFEALLHVTIGVYFQQQGFENAYVGQLRPFQANGWRRPLNIVI